MEGARGDGRARPLLHRTRWTALAVALWLSASCPTAPLALGTVEHPSAEESVLGVRGVLWSAGPLTGNGEQVRRWYVECSESAWRGVSGLHTPGVRAGVRVGAATLDGGAAQLKTDIGHETMVSFTTAWHERGRWAVSAGLTCESAYVRGFPPARLVSLTVRSRLSLTPVLAVGGEVDRYRLSGEENAGADALLAVEARPIPEAAVYAVADFDRWSGVLPSIAMVIDGGTPFRVSIGYQGRTSALKAALAVRVRGLACAAGVHYHRSLGVRQVVTVTWHG